MLGEPARLAILDRLLLGDASPGELGVPSDLLAHHVKLLEQAGVVERPRTDTSSFDAGLRSDLASEMWRSGVVDAAQRLCLPDIDERAMEGRFATTMPGRNTDQSNQENDGAGGDCGSVSQRTRQGWLSQYLYHQGLRDVQDACQPV